MLLPLYHKNLTLDIKDIKVFSHESHVVIKLIRVNKLFSF